MKNTLRASLSGTFLQTPPDLSDQEHAPSISFRHLPPNSARFIGSRTRSEHLFPAPSSKLRQIYRIKNTLRASLSGTFLQTPPDLSDQEHAPSIAFRHLPPNSARFGYATEGALFISAQLSSDAVSGLRKVRVLI